MVWRRANKLSNSDARRADELRKLLTSSAALDPGAPVDWRRIARLPRPEPLHTEEEMAKAAERALDTGWLERLLGRASTRRKRRYEAVLNARFRDGIETQRRINDWDFFTSLANGVLSGRAPSYIVAMEHLSCVSRRRGASTQVLFRATDSQTLEARMELGEDADSVLQSGRAYEIAAEVANDAFALLPATVVRVEVGRFAEELTLEKRWQPLWTGTFDRTANARIAS